MRTDPALIPGGVSWYDPGMDDRGRKERDKLSWRERDALGKKSRHVRQEREGPPSSVQKRGEALAKKALEDLFTPKKSKEQSAEWKKVAALSGREFQREAVVYVDKNGLPKEWDDLMRLLDHESPEFLLKVLDQIEKRAEHEAKGRLELAVAKMGVVKLTQEHPAVVRRIDALCEAFSNRA